MHLVNYKLVATKISQDINDITKHDVGYEV